MQIIYPIIFLLISLKWVKWNYWQQYYPTVLFMVIGNLLYSFLFKDYPLWRFEYTFEEKVLPTRMSIDLIKTFTSFPILAFIFLSLFPEERKFSKIMKHILTWTFLFGAIEYVSKFLGMISYHHGWNMCWSLVFDFSMFTLLAIHYKHPIIAWILSAIFIMFLWNVFDINFELLE
ncbi:MAG TPA: CBO0543 family protein [Metabacillus sp.]|nr:CBO0543 family protein [Metabacillus sp.]